MASEDLVTEQFSVLGVELEGIVLKKCVDLCNSNDLDAETFVEQWMAFSLSYHNGAAPTIQLLELMERKTFTKKDGDRSFAKEPHLKADANISIYGGDNLSGLHDDVLSDYLPAHPKTSKDTHATENDVKPIKAEIAQLSSLRPITYSPSPSQSVKYSARANSGDVLCSFPDDVALEKCGWFTTLAEACKIQPLPNHAGSTFSTKAMYGFELLQEKAGILDSNIKYLSQHVLHKADLKESASVRCKSQIPITIVGRIDCDSNGRLNPKSVLLQGTWEESLGHSIPIDLDQVKQYSLFPGQVVAMKGLNVLGEKFLAHEIFNDASYVEPIKIKTEEAMNEPLQLVVASGPFTTSDSLTYDPLMDIIQYITKNKPHAAILIGPFVDANHQSVKDNTIAETYKTFFETLLDKIMNAVESSSPYTQVIIAASSKDIFHCNIYPTPAFTVKKSYANLTMVPDPCILNISGTIIGVTSTDILMHLSKEEISLPAQGPDKLGRLASHLLNQQSFYPLWPPSPTLAVDAALWNNYAHITATPHILVLPSDFRYFAKHVNGCLVINPERLTKGEGGGTFARIQVNSNLETQQIKCQILRV